MSQGSHLRWRRRARRAMLALLALVGLLVVALLGFQRLFVFPRYVTRADPRAGHDVPGLTRLVRTTPDGDVEAWLLAGRGVDREHPGPLVVFAHGNAEVIDHWPAMLAPYREMGVSVLLPEFRGYGRSAGSPSEESITDDFVHFVDLALARPEVDRARVVYHGRSLGGGVVCALAARRAPRALVLMSTFTSIADIMRAWLIPRSLVLDPFDNAAVLAHLDVPVLLVHGRRDRVVPFSHAERLRGVARGPVTFVEYASADHNDCPPDWRDFFRRARAFLAVEGIVAAQ